MPYDAARVKFAKLSSQIGQPPLVTWAWGGVSDNTHERIQLMQEQVEDPAACWGSLEIQWESVLEAKWLQTGTPVARPEEK